MSMLKIVLLTVAFIASVACIVWLAGRTMVESPKTNGYKRLSGTVAEGLVFRVGREKFPRATCSACRVGKMKMGLISLGAFNTIEFDDLVINIPEVDSQRNSHERTKSPTLGKSGTETDALVETLGLKSLMAMAHADAKKFAGIRISNFQVNRMSGDELQPVVQAASLRNSGKRLIFHNATLYRNGEKLDLNEVELIVQPRFKLIWSTGSWDLSEMLSPTKRSGRTCRCS